MKRHTLSYLCYRRGLPDFPLPDLFHSNSLDLAADFPCGVDCGHVEAMIALNDQKTYNSVYKRAKVGDLFLQ